MPNLLIQNKNAEINMLLGKSTIDNMSWFLFYVHNIDMSNTAGHTDAIKKASNTASKYYLQSINVNSLYTLLLSDSTVACFTFQSFSRELITQKEKKVSQHFADHI